MLISYCGSPITSSVATGSLIIFHSSCILNNVSFRYSSAGPMHCSCKFKTTCFLVHSLSIKCQAHERLCHTRPAVPGEGERSQHFLFESWFWSCLQPYGKLLAAFQLDNDWKTEDSNLFFSAYCGSAAAINRLKPTNDTTKNGWLSVTIISMIHLSISLELFSEFVHSLCLTNMSSTVGCNEVATFVWDAD